MVEPARWMVAHSGTTKPATGLLTPLASAHLRVTGIVASDDDVPRAVTYAGSMFLRIFSGLRRA